MNCKNCTTELKNHHNFCPNCGAKVIRNRLTIKNLWSEFSERFFNYDNTFFKTFRHLFVKPEVVIDSFVDGTRKKYLNVFNYFAISITVTGFFTFIYLKFFPEIYTGAMDSLQNAYETEAQQKMFTDMMSTIFDYQSIIYFMMIPIFALVSIIVFYNYKKYNYTEHAVIYLYAYSHITMSLNILYLICILTYQPLLNYMSLLSIPISILFIAYVLKRVFELSFKKIVLKTLLFLVVGSIFYIGLVIVIGILMLITMFFDGSLMEMIEEQRRLRGK